MITIISPAHKPRVANNAAREYVQKCKPFIGSNTFAEWVDGYGSDGQYIKSMRYIVYSYGPHWPLFIYEAITDRWYENASRYGQSTNRQHSQLHPHMGNMVPLHVDDMCKVAAGGITALIPQSLETV